MKWLSVSSEWAKKIVSAGIHCELTGDALRISAVSECLRTMSFLCSALGRQGCWEPAASIRLTGMVRRRLVSLWPDLTDEDSDEHPGVMNILDSLESIGDMIRLEGGRWLPAPAHAVQAGGGCAVLLGGGPMIAFPQAMKISARVAGRIRLVEQSACEGSVDLWDAKEWIGAPYDGLDEWSKRLLDETVARLTDSPDGMKDIVVYQHRKWINLSDLSASEGGIYLCKAFGESVFSYFIGEFIKGRLRRLSTIGSSDDVRRLRFYLDAQANHSIRIKVSISQGFVKFKLNRRLPKREARVLLLGWQVPTPEGEHPGVAYYVLPEEVLPILRTAFKGLRIVLDES